MNNVFNEQMTSYEARSAFFAAVDGKSREEIEKLKAEYTKALPAIYNRERKLADEGWLL